MGKRLANNFRYGETSKLLAARFDTEAFNQGCSEAENVICMKQGGVKRRPPLKQLIDTSKYGIKWLIPFMVTSDNSFIVLMSNDRMYFARWNKDGADESIEMVMYGDTVASIAYNEAEIEQFSSDTETETNLYVASASPEIVKTIADSEFSSIRYAQYYNLLYIVSRNFPVLRLEYDEVLGSFSLYQARIIVNQDVDYKLKQEEKDKGYKISQELGWDTFHNVELNTPPSTDGKKHYPSVISIIGESMWLGNTEANPETIWVSRPYGSSQVLESNDNKSIQDFVQFQIVETDSQTLKDSADFPMKTKTDDNGYDVLKYDDNLNPIYRIPRGIEVVCKKHTETVNDTPQSIEGLEVDNRLIAIKTSDTDSYGFPVYINMSGDKLYNRICEYDTGEFKTNGDKVTIKYVAGLYSDSSYSDCFVKAKIDDNGKPVTDKDTDTETDSQLDGNPIFTVYTVRLYSLYGVPTGGTETIILSGWFNKNHTTLAYDSKNWGTLYYSTDGTKMTGEYADFYLYRPWFYNKSPDSINLTTATTSKSFTGWVTDTPQTFTNMETEPKSESIPEKPWVAGESNYDTYSGVEDIGEFTYKKEVHVFSGEGWKKLGSCFEGGSAQFGSYAEMVEAVTDPYNGQTITVSDHTSRGFLGIYTCYNQKYIYDGEWAVDEDQTLTIVDKYKNIPESEAKPTPANTKDGDEYTTYTIQSGTHKYSGTVTHHRYTNSATKAVYFGGEDVFKTNISGTKYGTSTPANTVTNSGLTYTATDANPIEFVKNGNDIQFLQDASVILSFKGTSLEDNSGNSFINWETTATSFTVNLSTSAYTDSLYPIYKNSTIYKYCNSKDSSLFIEGNAYEETDLSDNSKLIDYDKALTKTATSSTAMQIQLASGKSNDIKWFGVADKIIVGTANGEWRLPSGINALDGSASPYSHFGSETGMCTNINTDFVFLQRNNIARLMYSDYYGTHNIDLSATNPEITEGKIVQMITKQTPDPIIFFLKNDGTVVNICIDRDNQIQGWTRLSFGAHSIKSLAIAENDKTQTLLALCEQTIYGTTYSYLCQFNEDFTDEESHVFKDCGYTMSETEDESVDANKIYYKANLGGYVKTTDSDYNFTYEQAEGTVSNLIGQEVFFVDVSSVKTFCIYNKSANKFYYSDGTQVTGKTFPTDFYYRAKSFKTSLTYYEVTFSNYSINYTSKITTNPYDAQTESGEVTMGSYRKVDRVIFRALDTGKVNTYSSSKIGNKTLYNVCENQEGLGDFQININGGATKDLALTVESVEGDPMTLLAVAYEMRFNGNGN